MTVRYHLNADVGEGFGWIIASKPHRMSKARGSSGWRREIVVS